MSQARELIQKLHAEFAALLSDPTIPSSPEECAKAIEMKKQQYAQQLEKAAEQAIAKANYVEVSRDKVGEKEISRRVVRSWVSGNTQYTEYEITMEEEYKIKKQKALDQAKKDISAMGNSLNKQLHDFASKCAQKAQVRAMIQALEDQEKQQNWEEGIMYFQLAVDVLLNLLPGSGLYKIMKTVWQGAKLVFHGGKISRMEAPRSLPRPAKESSVKPIPQEDYKILPRTREHPTGADRTIPRNLEEQLLEGSMSKADKQGYEVMATKKNIRDIQRIEADYGVGDWKKAKYVLKNNEGKTRAEIHFYVDDPRKLIVEPKFKDHNIVRVDPLQELISKTKHK